MREPPNLANFSFSPLENVKFSYREYVEFLKKRLEFTGKCVLETQAKLQQEQANKQLEKVKTPNKFREKMILYLLAPSASSLNTNTLKFKADYIGPLILDQIVEPNKAILTDLEGRMLHGIFHFNRLKPGFVRLNKGIASTLDELRQAFPKNQPGSSPQSTTENTNVAVQSDTDRQPMSFMLIEDDLEHNNMPENAVDMGPKPEKCPNLSKHFRMSARNCNFGFSHILTEKQVSHLKKQANLMPEIGAEISISKIRCKEGHLQVLMTSDHPQNYTFWIDPLEHPNLCLPISKFLEETKLKPSGNPTKLLKKLFY